MARRGAGLADIKTTEELEELLKIECLHVLNVYSGFFGLCNAIATNLRDFKMIHGGDDLRVTTVNVDQIDVFKRFRNKSEPAYLIVLNGRVINSYYGCNAFALIEIIKDELELYKSGKPMNRQTFDLREMSALEAQRFRIMREKMISDRKQYQAKKQKIVYDYKMSVTDSIMENVADIGVTIFMPHVIDDELLGNLAEHATRMNMQQKTSIVTQITKLDLEMINFDGKNMSPLLFNHIRDKDVLIVAWKMASVELRPINEVFSEFARSLRVELDFGKSTTKANAVKATKAGKKQTKKEKKKDKKEENETENQLFQLPVLPVSIDDLQREKADPIQIEPIDLQFIESENDVIKMVCESITTFTEQNIVKIHNECIRGALVDLIDSSKSENVENVENGIKQPKKTLKSKRKSTARADIIYDPKDKNKAYVCPVWTPPTPRSHASVLFLYFRRLLSFFLPLDPPSALSYVIVAFSATRHEEILKFMTDNVNYKADILAHGFFHGFVDGENFSNAKLICKTGVEYRMGIQQPGDKLILQVCSNTEALLALVDLEPEFVSLNEHDAQIESDIIFPLGYVSLSEADAELEMLDKKVDGAEETLNGHALKSEVDSQPPEADNADIRNDTNVITE